MKEELQDKLVEILGSIQTSVGSAKDFALTQLPDVAQSYVAYGRTSETVSVSAGIALLIFVGFMIRKMIVWTKTNADIPDEVGVVSIVSTICSAIVGLMLICINLSSFLLVWMAPKVWLLKEIARMVR